jgi:hypothetical protein
MAVSICFGLLVATVLTLLYVPALYLIVVDFTNLLVDREQRLLRAEGGMRPPAQRGLRPGGNTKLKASGDRVTAAGSRQKLDDRQAKAEVAGQRTAVRGRRTGVGRRRTEVAGQKAVPRSLKTAAVKKAAAAGEQMTGAKSRNLDVREQRAENPPLKQTTHAGKRQAETRKQKKKVTI